MIDSFQLQMDGYLPLRDVVFQTLRQAIMKGDLQPGERLMEIHLASKLGVSRTPVREAIRKLELEGLVNMIPRKGAVVAEITVQELEDVLEVRMALEELAVKLACRNVTEETLAELKKAEAEFEKALASSDSNLIACAQTDEAFHEAIYGMTRNRRLVQLLSNLREQMYRYRLEYLKDRDSHAGLVREHEEILHALMTRDEETAVRATIEHIERQKSKIIELILQK